MPDATAIQDLPQLTWRGSKLWVSNIDTSWSHRLPERVFLDIDGEAHDWTGRNAFEVTADIHFLNTIEPGLYPDRWATFRASWLKGEIGELRHPDIGLFNARPADVNYTITAKSTAGISVRVRWRESIRDADSPTKIDSGAGGATAAAESCDAAIAALGISYPDGMQEPSFGAMLGALESFGTILENQISGKFGDAINTIDRMYNLLQSDCQAQQNMSPEAKEALAASPYRWVLEKNLNDLRSFIVEAAKAAEKKAKPTKTFVSTNDATMSALSLQIPADISGLVALNPKLLATPVVPKGTSVLYYAD